MWNESMKHRYNAAFLKLKTNMRNSENIINASSCMGWKVDDIPSSITPSKNVQGPLNYYYLNDHSVSHDLLIVAAIKKYFSIDESLVILTDTSESIYEMKTCLVSLLPQLADKIVCLPKYVDGDVSHIIDKVERFLENPVGIFITDPDNFHGAQARNTIIFHGNDQSIKEIRNIVLRTISFSIQVIANRENIEPKLGLLQDTDLHEFINIDKPVCEELSACSISYGLLASAVVNNFFKSNSEHNIILITPYKIALKLLEDLCHYFKDKQIIKIQNNYLSEDKIVIEELNNSRANIMDSQSVIVVVDNYRSDLFESNSFLNNVEDIIIISTKSTAQTTSSDYDITCRNLILKSRFKSRLIIHSGNLDDYERFFTLKEKTNLQELLEDLIAVPMISYYKNVYELNNEVITLALLNMYPSLKHNIVFIIKKGNGKQMMKSLKLFCNDEFICCDFENEYGAELVALKNSNLGFDEKDILTEVKMIVVFEAIDFLFTNFIIGVGNKRCLIIEGSNDMKYELHGKLVNSYGAYSHIFNVEILENHILNFDFTKKHLESLHVNNKNKVDVGILTTEVIEKYLKNYSEEFTTVITCNEDTDTVYNELYNHYEKQASCFKYDIGRSFFSSHIDAEVEALVNNQSAILILNVNYYRWVSQIFQRVKFIEKADNIIIITNSEHNQYDLACRNLLMRLRPKFSIVIHNGDHEVYSQFITMRDIESISEDNLAQNY